MGLFDGLDIHKMRKAVEDGAKKVQDDVTSGKVLQAVGDTAKKAQDGIANANNIGLDGLASGALNVGKKAVYGAVGVAADVTSAGKDALGKRWAKHPSSKRPRHQTVGT
jgi:hypothetical protein